MRPFEEQSSCSDCFVAAVPLNLNGSSLPAAAAVGGESVPSAGRMMMQLLREKKQTGSCCSQSALQSMTSLKRQL